MQKARLTKIGLSTQTSSRIIDHPKGVNGLINISEKGNLYVLATIEGFIKKANNELEKIQIERPIIIYDEPNKTTVKQLQAAVGSFLDGDFVMKKVESYFDNGTLLNTYTTFVFKKENVYKAFEMQQHPIDKKEG